MTLKQDIMAAAPAEDVPAGESGLWSIGKKEIEESTYTFHRGKVYVLNPCTITTLRRITGSTMHLSGEVVMDDSPFEIRSHLNFMMKARGNVLVSGLGLGCVVRGLLANPAVKHVTCIEISQNVLELVKPFMPKDRLTIIHDDALKLTKPEKSPLWLTRFDCAWHDIWADRDNGDPHLSVLHGRLMANCRDRVQFQGAWDMPRWFKKRANEKGLRIL